MTMLLRLLASKPSLPSHQQASPLLPARAALQAHLLPSPALCFPRTPSSPTLFSPQSNPPKPLRIWSPKPASATALPSNPPKPLRIWSPKPASATALPVLLFQHGFSAQTIYYSRLLSRVASHGFIVVAPQPFYPVPSFAVLCRHFSSHPICSHLSSSLPPGLPPAPLTSSPISKSNVPKPLRIWSPKPTQHPPPPLLSLPLPPFSPGPSSPHQSNPPRPLRIWSPKPATATALPVLLFQHGFSAQTSMYSQLLTRIAKHGYIVVAPQVCGCVHSVYRWVRMGLVRWLSVHLVLIFQHGYSQLLTRIAKYSYIFVALQIYHHIDVPFNYRLQYNGPTIPFSSSLSPILPPPTSSPLPPPTTTQMYPVTAGYNTAPEMRGSANVIGWLRKRLAKVLANRLKVKAVPDWDKLAISGHSRGAYFGHKYYYSDLADSAYHVVMPRYGHADFNNDMRVTVNVCPGGQKKVKARVATAGLVVAFLKAKLEADSSDLDDVLANPGHAPVTLSPVESK
ncbi:unnamed protein product [Closterium sp. NIES-65]|nr:unnamed protein product [Closterium sp. NIES-65]